MAIIPLPGIVMPQGTGPAPHLGPGNYMGVSTTTGQIRYNTAAADMEVWTGTNWHSVSKPIPVTWPDWFDYYVCDASDNLDRYQRQQQIHRMMQERFPGQYQVDCHNGVWTMIHDTPADETWFHLQYE
jgi:hypothetical protein